MGAFLFAILQLGQQLAQFPLVLRLGELPLALFGKTPSLGAGQEVAQTLRQRCHRAPHPSSRADSGGPVNPAVRVVDGELGDVAGRSTGLHRLTRPAVFRRASVRYEDHAGA